MCWEFLHMGFYSDVVNLEGPWLPSIKPSCPSYSLFLTLVFHSTCPSLTLWFMFFATNPDLDFKTHGGKVCAIFTTLPWVSRVMCSTAMLNKELLTGHRLQKVLENFKGLFLDIEFLVLLLSSWFSKPQYPLFISVTRQYSICHHYGNVAACVVHWWASVVHCTCGSRWGNISFGTEKQFSPSWESELNTVFPVKGTYFLIDAYCKACSPGLSVCVAVFRNEAEMTPRLFPSEQWLYSLPQQVFCALNESFLPLSASVWFCK